MVGNLKIEDQVRQTYIRNAADYETYIIAINQDYDSGDSIFNASIY